MTKIAMTSIVALGLASPLAAASSETKSGPPEGLSVVYQSAPPKPTSSSSCGSSVHNERARKIFLAMDMADG